MAPMVSGLLSTLERVEVDAPLLIHSAPRWDAGVLNPVLFEGEVLTARDVTSLGSIQSFC